MSTTTALRIAQLGGRVLKQPDDIPNTGRFAVVQDPYGATFGIYTPKTTGAGKGQARRSATSPGSSSTRPILTARGSSTRSLFGWEKTSAMDMGEMGIYQMFGRGGGIPNGGIMKPPPGAPAAWMPYALVKDAKAAAATAHGQRRQDRQRPDGSARRRLDRAGHRSAGRDVLGALAESHLR